MAESEVHDLIADRFVDWVFDPLGRITMVGSMYLKGLEGSSFRGNPEFSDHFPLFLNQYLFFLICSSIIWMAKA
jgi:hypothetical protein